MAIDKNLIDQFIKVATKAALSAAILSFFPTKYEEDKAAFEVTIANLFTNFLSIVIKFFHLLNHLV